MNKTAIKFSNRSKLFLLAVTITVFALSCERPVSVSPPDEPPPDGLLFIDSSPNNARIFVSGKDRRRYTPDSIRWMATGDYQILLKKEFWRDTTFMASVVEGERTEVNIDYLSNPSMMGTLNCNSRPVNATILLDNVETGLSTPSIIGGLQPGYHSIKLIVENHRSAEDTIIVRSSQVTNITASLVDTTLWKVFEMSNANIPTNNFTAVFVDSRGIVWAGTLDDGLVKYENGVWTNYRTSNADIPSNQILCIEEGDDGSIWVGTFDGLLQIKYPSTFFKWNYRNSGLPNMHINDIAAINVSIWSATDNGLCRAQRSDQYYWFDIVTANNSILPSAKVTQIEVYGIYIWAGTDTGGLVRFSNSQNLTIYNTSNGLVRNAISALEIDRDGIVWAGHGSQVHAAGGLSRFNGVSWEKLSHLVNAEDVTFIFADSRNNKWVATTKAVYIIANTNVARKLEYETTGLDFESVSGISEDKDGFIWLATKSDGLIRVDSNKL